MLTMPWHGLHPDCEPCFRPHVAASLVNLAWDMGVAEYVGPQSVASGHCPHYLLSLVANLMLLFVSDVALQDEIIYITNGVAECLAIFGDFKILSVVSSCAGI